MFLNGGDGPPILQPPGIGDGDPKQIKGCGLVAEPINAAVPDQPLVDPAELAIARMCLFIDAIGLVPPE